MISTMVSAGRFAIVAALALVFALAPVRAEEAGRPAHAEAEHGCLDQKERRAEIESGRLVRLAVAMHAAKSRMPGTVVRARLCHGQIAGQDGGLVYVLTVLAHDGKVARIAVDAVKGTLVGGR
jgi:uncharacterized membrane protein YkoI